MNKNAIIILVESPILNPAEIKQVPGLSTNYTVYLNSLLFSNWVENLTIIKDSSEIVTILSEKDKEYLPKNFLPEEFRKIFYNNSQLVSFPEDLLKQQNISSSNIIVLFHNSIGLRPSDILRVFNLIQEEAASVVIAKSGKNKIVLACSNNLDNLSLNSLLQLNREYSEYLNIISSKDIFINTLEGFLSIDDFEDIKKLYIELSKKESLSYCSQKMHESFNDLFIEYKELLNV
jgi:hypothetical protein